MKIGDKVKISSEAVADSELSYNEGKVTKLWDEPLANSNPTPLAEVLLDDNSIAVIGQHELTNIN